MAILNNNVFPIENAPDDIILRIFDLLPLKEVVATQFLSKTWRKRSLWQGVFTVNICNSPFFPGQVYEAILIHEAELLQRFNSFVREVLVKLECLKNIRICIAFHNAQVAALGLPHIKHWIDFVINRGGVKKIEVRCIILNDDPLPLVALPVTLISCKTLGVLDLYGITIQNFQFPNLPVLKTINLTECDFHTSACFISLLNGSPAALNLVSIATIFSSVQNLSFLECLDMKFKSLCIALLPLTICHLPVHAFYNVQELEIEMNRVCTYMDPIPMFHNIRKLSLSSVNSNWRLLFQIINSCPHVGILELNEGTGLQERDFVSRGWNNPDIIPHSIQFELKIFIFRVFLGEQGEAGFCVFVLKHAKALKTMEIHCKNNTDIGELISADKSSDAELRIIRGIN